MKKGLKITLIVLIILIILSILGIFIINKLFINIDVSNSKLIYLQHQNKQNEHHKHSFIHHYTVSCRLLSPFEASAEAGNGPFFDLRRT